MILKENLQENNNIKNIREKNSEGKALLTSIKKIKTGDNVRISTVCGGLHRVL